MTPVASTTPKAPVVGTAAPSTGAASTPLNTKGALDKNAFLTLLVTQMKNQDPLNPASSDQMAAQLAQFSSLEQLQTMNATLTGQTSSTSTLIDSIHTTAAMGTLGKQVTAVGDAVVIPNDGSDPSTIALNATYAGPDGNGVLTITDDSGKVVASRNLGAVGNGPYTTTLGSAASGLAPGNYHFGIQVTDSTKTQTAATTYTTGRVDSVQATANGPVLICGAIAIPFSSVIEIKN
ncbi:MAG: flagellar hook capping FlgD N-terminal domain-containing protein [bacterium]